jgi:hypothetical protein
VDHFNFRILAAFALPMGETLATIAKRCGVDLSMISRL